MAMHLARDGDRNDTKNSGKTCDNRATACIKEGRVVKPFMNYAIDAVDHSLALISTLASASTFPAFLNLQASPEQQPFFAAPHQRTNIARIFILWSGCSLFRDARTCWVSCATRAGNGVIPLFRGKQKLTLLERSSSRSVACYWSFESFFLSTSK